MTTRDDGDEVAGARAEGDDIEDGQDDRAERTLRRSTGRDAIFEEPDEGDRPPEGGAAAEESGGESASIMEFSTPQGAISSDNSLVMDRILQALNAEMHQQLAATRQQLGEAQAATQRLESVVQRQELEINTLKQELDEALEAKLEVVKERDLLAEACASARFEVDDLSTQLQEAKSSADSMRKEMEDLRTAMRDGNQIAKEADPKVLYEAIVGGNPAFVCSANVRESLMEGGAEKRRESLSKMRASMPRKINRLRSRCW